MTWHPDGLKESEGEFRAGKLVSQWAHWDTAGKLLELREAMSEAPNVSPVVAATPKTRVDVSADRSQAQPLRRR